ncbi:MAG: PQQ-binding-like beta-propeller repeat protein [Planctomycetia bacterium]|nr:PQQ-binding-like beta-propeller repeat protein [Planctomycetia bacterium]
MQLTVDCPACQKRYHLNDELRGKKMRCHNPICREVFEIQEGSAKTGNGEATTVKPQPAPAPSEKTPAGKKDYQGGFIGEMVPLVTAEAAEAPPADSAVSPPAKSVGEVVPLLPAEPAVPAASAWQNAPPPVRRGAAETAKPAEPQPAPVEKPAAAPSWQIAPPVRRPVVESPRPPEPAKTAAETPKPLESPKPAPKPPEPVKPAAPETTAWQNAPPPVRRTADEPPKPAEPAKPRAPITKHPFSADTAVAGTKRDLEVTKTVTDGPREVAAGQWSAPPVRRASDEAPKPPAEVPAPVEPASASVPVPATQRFGKLIVVMLLLLCVGVGIAVYVTREQPEVSLLQQAETAFGERNYREAAKFYALVLKADPDSPRKSEYEFRRDLSLLLAEANQAVFDEKRVIDDAKKFVLECETDPKKKALLDENKSSLWDVFRASIERALEAAEKEPLEPEFLSQPDYLEETEKKLALIEGWIEDGKAFWPDPAAPPASYRERIAKLRQERQRLKLRQAVIRKLERMLNDKPTLPKVEEAEGIVGEMEGLKNDPKVRELLKELWKKAVPAIVYLKPEFVKPPVEFAPPGILVGPRVGERGTAAAGNGIVFALARGVLYALRERDGQIQWATRVGIDSTQLPVRLPSNDARIGELALVVSLDTNTLTARRVSDGEPLWVHPLGNPCLGRPLVVERQVPQPEGGTELSRRVYVPTLDGRVQEIEPIEGKVLGEFRCGLPLPVGGTRQPDTSLLYFPADRDSVFVLDVHAQKVVAVLRTGHPSGSLRSPPIVVAGDEPNPEKPNPTPRYLVLCQTAGLNRMKLRAWQLGDTWENFSEKPVLEQELRGWSSFEPYTDSEKILLATDAGLLGLFGINQKNNRDPALFPLLGREREVPLTLPGQRLGQSQVIHAADNDFWVLAQGELQHWRIGIDSAKGLKAAPVWRQSLALGTPLHTGQLHEASNTLTVVTQAAERPVCLATAVEATTGNIRWQRQLGLVCPIDPLAIGTQVLAPDQGGGLFLFDAAKQPHRPQLEWQGVQEEMLIPPSNEVLTNQQFLTGPDGSYLIGHLGKDVLQVRRYEPPPQPNLKGNLQEWSFKAAALAGTPAVGQGQIILPMSDGSLRRQPLAKGAPFDPGQWRAVHADAGAGGHVVALGGDDFLVTDGSKGLQRITWPLGKLSQPRELKLPPLQRFVAAPLVVPAAGGKGPPRVCVADASGTLTLLQGDYLQKARSWQLPGAITAGPFLRGAHIGCVLDRRQLVWLDPDQAEPLWTYADDRGGPIVGQPRLVGDHIVLAHQNGRFISLDPATGKTHGKGFTLRASIAPAVAPVAFGTDRIFAPLTDGTVLLLPLAEVEKP